MSMFTGKSVDNFRQRADVLNREDIFCLSNKKIGRKNGDTDIYLMHYAYSGVIPTKVQIQDVVNKEFGQLVVIDPTEVMVGPRTFTVKAYTSYPLAEQATPKKYVNNLKASVEERPDTVLVEIGDVVRYFDATVVEGQIVSADHNGFAVRVGSTIERVAADSIIDVKQSPLFHPTDKAAYDYFLKLYPKDYAKELTNNVKDHDKNLSWTEKLSDSENKGEKELEKIHKLPTVQTWDLKKGEDGRPDHKDLPSWNLKMGEDGRPAHDGKGYTPAGDSWKEKEIADMKKEYSEGTESWFRQKKFKGGVNKQALIEVLLNRNPNFPQYDAVGHFHDGLAAVMITAKGCGFINTKGEEVIPLKYDSVGDFSQGVAKVMLNGKWGLVNTEGVEVVPPMHDDENFTAKTKKEYSEGTESWFHQKNKK